MTPFFPIMCIPILVRRHIYIELSPGYCLNLFSHAIEWISETHIQTHTFKDQEKTLQRNSFKILTSPCKNKSINFGAAVLHEFGQ